MKNPSYSRITLLLCGGALAGLLSGVAQATVYNPPILMTHGIEYMSGGVGSDEAELMETVEPRWPAAFEFAVKDGKGADFAGAVTVTVRNDAGAVVLDHVRSQGPYMVARLDPGHYVVEAELAGTTVKQDLTVQAGSSSKRLFMWPAGTDMQHAHS